MPDLWHSTIWNIHQPIKYNNNHVDQKQEANTGVYIYMVNEELTRPGD